MGKVNVSAKEVVQFFKDAPLDVAELVLSVGEGIVASQREKKAAASQRMAKARAGRGKGKKAEAPVAPSAPAPIRTGRVAAPSHTAAATSVESDAAISA